jgi:hypothetical protein
MNLWSLTSSLEFPSLLWSFPNLKSIIPLLHGSWKSPQCSSPTIQNML